MNQCHVQMFIGGIPPRASHSLLFEILSQISPIHNLNVVMDRATGISRGFAFFTTPRPEAFDCTPAVIGDRYLWCERKNAESNPCPNRRLFVGGLSGSTTDEHLKQRFSEYGEVRSAYVIHDRISGESKRFAFVTFEDHRAIDLALAQPHIFVEGKRVSVTKYERKSRIQPISQQTVIREQCSYAKAQEIQVTSLSPARRILSAICHHPSFGATQGSLLNQSSFQEPSLQNPQQLSRADFYNTPPKSHSGLDEWNKAITESLSRTCHKILGRLESLDETSQNYRLNRAHFSNNNKRSRCLA